MFTYLAVGFTGMQFRQVQTRRRGPSPGAGSPCVIIVGSCGQKWDLEL